MPHHYQNLKNVYKRTYEELKNPNSVIAVFLKRMDEYVLLEHADVIKEAIKEYIDVYEKECDNFVEPNENETDISYKEETKRLKKNLKVETKLRKAVQKMEDALDKYANFILPDEKAQLTQEEINQLDDYRAKLAAQRDRVLNASYGLEVEMEEKMIAELKAKYQAFDHRPIESKIPLPPSIKKSKEYRIRHLELRGEASVPTAVYGMVRFKDLLNDHKAIVTEAERSLEYKRFVNDTLAGHIAWKKTYEKEVQVYEEIRTAVDPEYFAEYNTFMDEYAGTSAAYGYTQWFEATKNSIDKMKKEISDLEVGQQSFEDEYKLLTDELEEKNGEYKIEEESLDNAVKEASKSEYLTDGFITGNNTARELAEKELSDLNKQLENLQLDMDQLDSEQKAAKDTMFQNVQRIQNYREELNQLKAALEEGTQEVLKDFLKNHQATEKFLDETLQENLDQITYLVKGVDKHNQDIKDAEANINFYNTEVNKLEERLKAIDDDIAEIQEKVDSDLDAQYSMWNRFKRTVGRKLGTLDEEKDARNQFAANSQEDMLEAFKKEHENLTHNVKTNEQSLLKLQHNLYSYKLGWESTSKLLKAEIDKGLEITTDIQQKLEAIHSENETKTATTEYNEKAQKLKLESEEAEKDYQNILDKTASDLDRLNQQKAIKLEKQKELQNKINTVKEALNACEKNSKLIEEAKLAKESAEKAREDFDVKKEKELKDLNNDINRAQENVTRGLLDLEEKRKKYSAKIKSHDALLEFYKQDKVTSNRVLQDLNTALAESMKIALSEGKKQEAYLMKRENQLMRNYVKRMKDDKETFASRMKQPAEADKSVEVDGRIFKYVAQLSAMKSSNSAEFDRLKKAVLKNHDEFNNFLLDEEIASALVRNKDREKVLKEVKDHLKEIADASKAYLKAKGSVNRFTKAGKERYRFADEMRTYAEVMLEQFDTFEKEKKEAARLMNMDTGNLKVSDNLSFYQTDSYKMTKDTFIKKGELDMMNDISLGQQLPGMESEEVKEEAKEEVKVKEEVKEDPIAEIEDEGLGTF